MSSIDASTNGSDAAGDPDFVLSLARGLAVVEALGGAKRGLSLSEAARAAGFSRASARRLLLTLERLGYVRQDDRRFVLLPRVLRLGYGFIASMSPAELMQSYMEEVTKSLRESCSVAMMDGDEIVYVARVPTSRIMTVALNVGTRLPAYCTSLGRVLLSGMADADIDAYLARVELRALTPNTATQPKKLKQIIRQARLDGYTMVDQELEAGVRSCGVPIRDRQGRIVAALNASGHASRVTCEDLKTRFLPVLLDAAAKISASLAR